MDIEAEIDRLYGVPLDEFVRERNELAKRVTKEGDREAAARVKALRKPTVGAWALNQAVRRRRAETEELLETGARLRDAHEQLLGGGGAGELREAMKDERRLTSALADCAEAIASEGGKSGPALRERVRATLHAASVDEEARSELASGRFLREREAVGLGAFGTSEAAAPEAPTAKPKSGGARKRGGRQSASDGAQTRERRASDAAQTREERAAEAARAREERQAEAAREREEALAEAEQALAEARSELESAEAEHADTLAALESAREELREAEDAEREARRTMRERSREVAKQERGVERMRPKA